MRSATKSFCLFIGCAAILLTALLWFNHYSSSQVYVVYLDDVELGIVHDSREIENFVDDLVIRCGNLYGLALQPGEEIVFDREFRAGSEPDPQAVCEQIRRKISFLAPAYLIKVDGKTFVPVAGQSELDKVLETLVAKYSSDSIGGESKTVLEAAIVEEVELEECRVDPEDIFSAEEVLVLLTANEQTDLSAFEDHLLAASDQLPLHLSSEFVDNDLIEAFDDAETPETVKTGSLIGESEIKIRVKTVEEITEIKAIPFGIDQVEDFKLFVSQTEIDIPGQEGLMEVIFHIVRENGTEIERITIEEKILEEPVTQVERIGIKELPTGGRSGGAGGSFIWPVQGEGIVYNGFKPGHQAIDIHIAQGTNILAADSGTVIYTGWGSTQGNYIIIHHGAYWTLYLHNSANLVQKGDYVSRGQVIGKVGATGRAKGAHLHFEVREDDGSRQWLSYYQHQAVNPMQFFR